MTFKRGAILEEAGSLGIILQGGKVSYDVVWEGGSTSRYRYSTGRNVQLVPEREFVELARSIKHLRAEANTAREERRTGARIKRGQVWPSR